MTSEPFPSLSASSTETAQGQEEAALLSPIPNKSSLKEIVHTPANPAIHHSLLAKYADFVIKNGDTINSIESSIRAASYILPGRFPNSEVLSELLYAGLGLFNLLNSTVAPYRATNLGGRYRSAYINYLKSQSVLLSNCLTALNVIKCLEIPLEAIMIKAKTDKWYAILLIEASKSFLRLAVWQHSGHRPILHSYMPPLGPTSTPLNRMLLEMDALPDPSAKARTLASYMSSPDDMDTVFAYLKANKMDDLLRNPEMIVKSLHGTSSNAIEIMHIMRPLLYVLMVMTTRNSNNKFVRWSPWIASLLVDMSDLYRDIYTLLISDDLYRSPSLTPIELQERQHRLISLLSYYIREPLYASTTAAWFEKAQKVMNGTWMTRPLGAMVNGYRTLAESFYFYSSSS